jgi:MFS family permease
VTSVGTQRGDEWRPGRWPVYGAGFVTAFGAHAVAANLGAYATGQHSSLWELGLLLGIYDGAEVVLKPVFGSVVDRRGAKPVMVAGLLAFALASAAFALVGGPQWLGLARLAQGGAAAAFSPAAGAAVAGLGGQKRTGRLFGGYGGAKSVGYLVGPLVGGAVVAAAGYRLLFALTGAVALAAAGGVLVRVPSLPPAPRQRSGVSALIPQLRRPAFLRPVLLLAAGTGALSAGVGFLPLLGARHDLSPAATGAMVSLMAASAALIQPWAGRRHDAGALPASAPSMALVLAAAGFGLAVVFPGAGGLVAAALLVGTGVAVVTPVGFAQLAAAAPPGRLGRTMGAGEVGRELGDAGGPVLVGAFGPFGLGAGLAALAGALVVCAGLSAPRRSASSSHHHPPAAEEPANP